MAEEEKLAVDGSSATSSSTVAETEESKVEQELDRSRGGDSDEVSGGSLSEDEQRRGGSDSDQRQRKGRRQRRLKGGKRHRKHHPYAVYRAAMKAGEFPHAPRNTTQYLIEDHVKSNISPDLSNKASPASFDETNDFAADRRIAASILMNVEPQQDGLQGIVIKEGARGLRPQDSPNPSALPVDPYTQEFIDVYQNFNEDRLRSMSKEELIQLMTSKLLANQVAVAGGGGGRRGVGAGADKIDKTGMGVVAEGLKDSPNSTPLSSCNRDNKME